VPNPPSGTVTFLFTDLEGSTRLWEEHPDAMKAALARHDEILRTAIESHGGYVVKTTGDGFHAAFGRAADALDAAVAAQLALDTEDWGATGPLQVRMGLHTGEAELRDGDYYGTVLNRAARIMSAGHGGQVLVSRTTAELAGDALTQGCDLVDVGEHRLRDLGRAEALFQLSHPGLRRAFPPVQSLDAYPGNLPPQLTSFVGREQEMDRITGALRNGRLVTLTGVGGVGKTRLALQIAAEMLPEFPDGAWFCELATAGDPDALVQVIAAALSVQPVPTVPLDQRVVDALRERRALVILDNCEHLLDGASSLADRILRGCPHVRLIATSREPLDVDGERIVRVRSLPVAENDSTSDATQLFVERALGVDADFTSEGDSERAVTEICRRLDGIPLAIELAAARVVAMTPGEIAELLDERFRLLTGGRRTAVERHQTLRATVDWSYSLLSETERLVFNRLGVFPGSFDAVAARAVTSGDGVEDWDVRDALTSLVNKSMVNTASGPDTTTRYQLLETMRQYAREQLDDDGDSDHRRRAHAAHYADRADEIANAMATGVGVEPLRSRGVLDLDNSRSAITWSLDSDTPEDHAFALRIAGSLAGADPGARRTAGLIASEDRLLEYAETATPELRAGVFSGLANDAYWVRGDINAATEYATRAIADTQRGGTSMASAYAILSRCAAARGDFDGARDILEEGAKTYRQRQGHVPHFEAFFEILLSHVERGRGDPARARLHAEEAVRQARASELPYRLTQALNTLAAALRYDDLAAAERAAEEAERLARSNITGEFMSGNALAMRAELSRLAGKPTEALRLLRAAVIGWGDNVPTDVLVAACVRSGVLFADAGAPRDAAVIGGAAEQGQYSHLLAAANDPPSLGAFRERLAQSRERLGAEEFDAQVARGARMSPEETLRFIRTTAEALLGDAESVSD
jgi:predicted ATPase/class 3 adenylate cyclase